MHVQCTGVFMLVVLILRAQDPTLASQWIVLTTLESEVEQPQLPLGYNSVE